MILNIGRVIMKHREFINSYSLEQIVDGAPDIKPNNPSLLPNANFLMCAPFCFHASEANNAWMQNCSDEERKINTEKSFQEFHALYQFLVSQGAFVHLMPVPEACNLQDLVFCANAGIALYNTEQHNTFVVSNFTSPPRFGETPVIENVMNAMGYRTIVSPHKFEGEADLKLLYNNIYIGGYGIRSDKATYDWMEENFGIEVIRVHMNNEYLYHLDCSIFPITREDTLICTEIYDPSEIREIEKYTNIIDIDLSCAIYGMTNCVRVGRHVLNMAASGTYGQNTYSDYYKIDAHKRNQLENICGRLGLEPVYFTLDEYGKGGAALSCLVLHLNASF